MDTIAAAAAHRGGVCYTQVTRLARCRAAYWQDSTCCGSTIRLDGQLCRRCDQPGGGAGLSWVLAGQTPDQVEAGSEFLKAWLDAPPAGDGIARHDLRCYRAFRCPGALGAEVVWTRLMGMLLGSTVYVFSIILAVFLIGIGIGSLGRERGWRGLCGPGWRWAAARLCSPSLSPGQRT